MKWITRERPKSDLDAWETEFRRIGAGPGGGSGWVVLGFKLLFDQHIDDAAFTQRNLQKP